MPESGEASELFVGLSHISALTFQCLLTVKLSSLIYFDGVDFLKIFGSAQKKLGGLVKMCRYAKSHKVFCKLITIFFQILADMESFSHEAPAIFSHKL